ncbi:MULTISPECIES: SDR family NAD(P)-dependent oxidoreductase [unclassified Nocardia]|uniref:SDR family NAD(P)-dependent oxidoreductase n=1 Tax=unclassified Nocardia TaxID=2637762 RepID=UPI0027E0CEA8|nr:MULTISPECIES: SDR family NAD(P)-dependent oxidoreductase [unclassified Nocardia]
MADEVAIVGMACRVPGAESVAEYWRLLRDGVDATGAGTPRDRRLARVRRFDAAFFGIAPHEADSMDPQQRLTLELSWQALEDAGIAPAVLRGSAAGVFIGVCASDYLALLDDSKRAMPQHAMTGLHRSVIANRVSHHLDWHGPSLTIDAGQASSLAAIHLACASVRSGESRLAVAGGVQLNPSEQSARIAEGFGGLSDAGRVRTFDAAADGYVRGEGAAFVVLKRLAAARADGDRVYAVIRGSAVNHDGTGVGLVVPNARAQAEVLRAAHRRAGIEPAAVQYVELHGTGTRVGDPIEAEALGLVFGADRTGRPALRVGSTKTNIGHLEGAAGAIGVVKTALAVSHGVLPASLHFENPNPAIPFDELPVEVQTAPTPWPDTGAERIAGVSSFSVGGTNCHVVLAEPPAALARNRESGPVASARMLPWVLSARGDRALRAQAHRLVEQLAENASRPEDLAYSLVATREAMEYRAIVLADSVATAGPLLREVADGTRTGVVDRIVFELAEDPSGAARLAARLLARSALFREQLAARAAAVEPVLGRSVLYDVLAGEPESVSRPVHFTILAALVEFWRGHGIDPAGFRAAGSVSLLVAAVAAGALSLREAVGLASRDDARLETLAEPRIPVFVTGRPTESPSAADGHGPRDLPADGVTAESPRAPADFASAEAGGPREDGSTADTVLHAHAPTEAGNIAASLSASEIAELLRAPAALASIEPRDLPAGMIAMDTAFGGGSPEFVDLPLYAFQGEDHWWSATEDGAVQKDSPRPRTAAELRDAVRTEIAAILGDETADPTSTFRDLGFGSLLAVELRNRLSALTGLRLPTTVVFDHPTPDLLAAHLVALSAGTPVDEPVPAAPAPSDEPIAIVAMACRYPGGIRSPEDLWRVVVDGVDAISPFPADRGWDMAALADDPAVVVREGGFLRDVDQFDAAFFGIAPREAQAMDPQQRLLLECAWEAFERAAMDPMSLRGSRTGVFIGTIAQEYGPRLPEAGESTGLLFTGTTSSVASGRVAYVFGLEGPALTIDTACSSSLVALHQAALSLRSGECGLALAGGVTVLPSTGMVTEFSRLGALSTDGRCRAFAAGASGFGLAEGVGLLLLERLSDAQRLGHPVLAVLRGSAVNQDGASNGLTAPNESAQRQVIAQALRSGGLTPADVDAVEAHGTGTALGDPIEAHALLATYGRDRERPLLLGSLKSNIGHAQAAAGVGGVIKMVLALRHELLPKTLHAEQPTAHIDWASAPMRLLTEPVPWPRRDRVRRAGVSSFGVSGTNAHVIVEQAPEEPATVPVRPNEALPLLISAKTRQALRDRAQQLDATLAADPGIDIAELAASLAITRTHFPCRVTIPPGEPAAVRDALRQLAAGETDPRLVSNAGRTVFVFPGQGSQWVGMGRALLAASPVFARQLRLCADALAPHLGCDVVEVLRRGDAADFERVEIIQPVLFAVMVSLARLWQAYGVEPDAVVGHSQGEIAAAHIAGALSLADAAFISAVRVRLLQDLAGTGTMASVPLPADRVAQRLAEYPDIYVACVNSPFQTVVSGGMAVVREVVARWQDEGVEAKTIPVDYASHCPHIDAMRDELLAALRDVTPKAADIAFYSTVEAGVVDTTRLTAEYWCRNMREPVRLADTVRALIAAGHDTFIEASPHSILTVALEQTSGTTDIDATVLPTLHREQGGLDDLYGALGQAYLAGRSVDWATVRADTAGRGGIVFVFPGQGSQWVGMGRALLDSSPVFAHHLRACADALAAHVDFDVVEVLRRGDAADFGHAETIQPILFAVMVSLARLWQSYDVEPDAVVGHSQGEIAAAHISGAISLADAAYICVARAKTMEPLSGTGTMASVPLPVERTEPWLAEYPDLYVAGSNSPVQTIVSGGRAAIAALIARLREAGISARPIAMDYASHSPHVDVVREDLLAALRDVTPEPSDIACYSSVRGAVIDTRELTAEYWWQNLREPVRWDATVRALIAAGHRVFVEVSPHPILTVAVEQIAETVPDAEIAALATVRRGRDGLDEFTASIDRVLGGTGRMLGVPRITLPTYPFQRERFWLTGQHRRRRGHPVLDTRTDLAGRDEIVFGGTLGLDTHPWLADHVVEGMVLLPGTLFLTAAAHAAQAIGYRVVDELTLQTPAFVPEQGGLELQLVVGAPDADGRRQLTVHSRRSASSDWQAHATGALAPGEPVAVERIAWPTAGEPVTADEIYDRLTDLGYEYGPAFQGIQAAWRANDSIYLSLSLPEDIETRGYDVHPALLDAALQMAAFDGATAAGRVVLPFAWHGVRVAEAPSSTLRARLTFTSDQTMSAVLWDENGNPVVTAEKLTLRPLPAPAADASEVLRQCLFRIGWEPLAASGIPLREKDTWAVLGDPAALASDLDGIRAAADLAGLAESVPQVVFVPLIAAGIEPAATTSAAVPGNESAAVPAAVAGDGSAAVVPADGPEHGLAGVVSAAGPGNGSAAVVAAAISADGSAAVPAADAGDGSPADVPAADIGDGLSTVPAIPGTDTAAVVPVADTGDGSPTAPTPTPGNDTAAAVPAAVTAAVHAALGLVQAWLADRRFARSRLVFVTRAAVGIETDSGPMDLVNAPIWGLLRSAQSEHPDRFVLLDVDDTASVDLFARALDSGEPELVLRENRLLAPRLTRYQPTASTVPFDAESRVLITGGLGAIGTLVAKHLVRRHGVRRLILVGRGGPDSPHSAAVVAELAGLGAAAEVRACDAADRDALAELLAEVCADGPLDAVVHAAGVLRDATVQLMTPEQVDIALRPKVAAAWNLHELTKELPLRAFLVFSSIAATLGNAGQANYAAGNAFLDAIAQQRTRLGLPGKSCIWGLWSLPDGMAAGLGDVDLRRLARAGVLPITADDGMELFDAVTGADLAAVVAARFDTQALRGLRSVRPVLSGLIRRPARRAGADTPDDSSAWVRRMRAMPAAERAAAALRSVLAEVGVVAGGGSVDAGMTFRDLGFGSLMAVELRNRLVAATGLRLSSTTVFDHPTPILLSEHLAALVGTATEAEPVRAPAAVTAPERDPIAIVGMACRYPGGVESPEGLWQLAADGVDAVGAFPADRGWDLAALFDRGIGTSYAREGGFVSGVDLFDAAFFGVSPREAAAMDPQQRLLLETVWEVLERAGIVPETLRGSETGVFIGASSIDYGPRLHQPTPESAGYLLTGTAASVLSGRVAYSLGLEGPAITVDTACSSSLVALHLAARSLRSGECSLAIAGGVTVLSTPGIFAEFSRQQGLSADGRCRAFSADANGTGAAEGVGVLLVERLSDARRLGHPVLAVLRGSAVNQDGASNGLTAPNGLAQRRVIEQALRSAGLTPDEVDAVEAHGTGTRLGDPIEAQAVLATYGRNRERPLWLGSLKSNIGHAQAAAGVGGVIKMVQALRHELLPRTLHVSEPTPHVDWAAAPVRLLTEPVPWPRDTRVRRAAVSSFGISGTNAHVIVEQAPDPVDDARPEHGPVVPLPLLLSAKTEPALRDQARRLHTLLTERPELELADVATTLATARTHFAHRAAVTASDRPGMLESLAALADSGTAAPRETSGAGVTFLFAGQGTQRPGMGAELYQQFPAFAEAFDRVCAAFASHLTRPLPDIVFARPDSPEAELLRDTAYAQPALFAYEVALYRLVHSWGLRPDTVLGHSLGELVAAHIAGVLTLDDAATLVAARGRLMGSVSEPGAMVSVQAGIGAVQRALAGAGDRAGIAAVNGDRSIVVSGAADVVGAVADRLAAQGVKTTALEVRSAFHSPLMDAVRAEFGGIAAELTYHQPELRMISTVTGRVVGGTEPLDARYWVQQLREPVLFAAGLRAAESAGAGNFVEIGPDGTLSGLVRAAANGSVYTLPSGSAGYHPPLTAHGVVPLQRRDRPEALTLMGALGAAHVAGIDIDWPRVVAPWGGRRIPLPTYAFQRRRYWLTPATAPAVRGRLGHPILGAGVPDADRTVWSGSIALAEHPWLAAHVVGGRTILPAPVHLELAHRAAVEAGYAGVAELTVERQLPVPSTGGVDVRVVLEPDSNSLVVYAKSDEDADWVRYAGGAPTTETAALGETSETQPMRSGYEPETQNAHPPIDRDEIYRRLAEVGLNYGPELRGLTALRLPDRTSRDANEIRAEAELLPPLPTEAQSYDLHPALLDTVTQAIAAAAAIGGDPVRIPVAWKGYRVYRPGVSHVTVRIVRRGDDDYRVDLRDRAGAPAAAIDSVTVRATATPSERAELRRYSWTPIFDDGSMRDTPRVAVLTKRAGAAVDRLGECLRADIHADVIGLLTALGAAGRGTPDCVVLPYADGDLRTVLTEVREQIQQVCAATELARCRIVVLTRGALSVDAEPRAVDPVARAVWGMVRALRPDAEQPLCLVDEDGSDAAAAVLGRALLGDESRLAVRGGRMYRADLVEEPTPALELPPDPFWRLNYAAVGAPDDITVVVAPRSNRPLVRHEVRVALHTAGVNFRDVLMNLGVVSPRAGTPEDSTVQNAEGAGVVLEVGPGVDRLRPGDRVMGLFDEMSPVAIGDHRLLARVPDGWSLADAASVPVAFLTAYYGLSRLGQVRAGERVLIHTATGAVGMAAIQVARQLGAEVFATASPGKWPTLRALGIPDDHIASSRDASFEERFRANAPGRPDMDVVLNSLAGPLTDASLRLLTPPPGARAGRFLDMGKTDPRDPAAVADGYSGVAYSRFDIRDPGPDGVRDLLDELIELFEAGCLTPIPTTVSHVTEARQAFRTMAEARHLGKVVLRLRDWPTDRAVLLTGGMTASIARHMVGAHGVRLLVFVDGPGKQPDADLIRELGQLGAEIATRTADLGDRAAVAALLDELDRSGIRLGAIVHAAVTPTAPTDLDGILDATAHPAAHLHELTKQLDLSAFVLLAEPAATPEHAAANAYLDGLAETRAAAALPGLSITVRPLDITPPWLRLFDRAVALGSGTVVVAPPGDGPAPAAVPETGAAAANLLRLICTATAEVLALAPTEVVAPDAHFRELGLTSLGAIELRDRVSEATGVPLPPTLVFDYPTPNDLVEYLGTQSFTRGS